VPRLVFPRPTLQDIRDLGRLAVPIVLVQLGMQALGVEDTMIVGHYSSAGLAGVAIGTLYSFTLGSFGLGLIIGLEPLFAQAVGAHDEGAMARALQRGLLVVGVIGTLTLLATLPSRAVLRAAGQPEAIVDVATPYLIVAAPSGYAFLLFALVRVLLQSRGIMRPIVTAIVVGNVLNVVLSIALVFGLWGFPRMGPTGSAVATLIARFVMTSTLAIAAWPSLRPLLVWQARSLAWTPMLHVMRLGLPVGAQILLEFGVFALVGLVMGNLGPVATAGHQVALNLASLTYMVPLGIGTAGSVLVGRAIGAGRQQDARRVAVSALTCGVGFMAFSALVLLLVPGALARVYTNDPSTIAMASTLIPIAGVFQVFDGTQVVSIGVLRGSGDTRTPMLVNLVGYWFVALPLALWLGRGLGLGPVGLWWGLVAGLVVVALVVLVRARIRLSGDLRRIHIEGDHVPAISE
jgi:MATE family multidrug resistance protein